MRYHLKHHSSLVSPDVFRRLENEQMNLKEHLLRLALSRITKLAVFLEAQIQAYFLIPYQDLSCLNLFSSALDASRFLYLPGMLFVF